MQTKSIVLMLTALLAGCSVVDTYSVRQNSVKPRQAAGTYYLAKHLVRVVVDKVIDTKTKAVMSYNITTSNVAVPDARYSMQMGFALSPFSDDDVKVDYSAGLLTRVSAVATDRTSEILNALANARGRLREGAITTVTGTTTKISTPFSFDPYDPSTAEAVNRQIQQATGAKGSSCVEVEIHPGQWSPGCPASLSMASSPASDVVGDAPNYDDASLARKPGIYFRRSIPRTVHVVLRGKHVETSQLLFANDAPVYRVDIKRSAFVKRETVVTFLDGELTSVSVKKDSEALAVAKLPVSIVDAYVGGVVDALVKRKDIQEARANYYNALAEAVRADIDVSKARDERAKFDCLASRPIDTTECD